MKFEYRYKLSVRVAVGGNGRKTALRVSRAVHLEPVTPSGRVPNHLPHDFGQVYMAVCCYRS